MVRRPVGPAQRGKHVTVVGSDFFGRLQHVDRQGRLVASQQCLRNAQSCLDVVRIFQEHTSVDRFGEIVVAHSGV